MLVYQGCLTAYQCPHSAQSTESFSPRGGEPELAREYEMLYIMSPALSDEELAAAHERVNALVASVGTVGEVEAWGRKRLAYEIEDHKEGVYTLLHFNAEPEAPKEIERIMSITEGVLRYLVVRKGD